MAAADPALSPFNLGDLAALFPNLPTTLAPAPDDEDGAITTARLVELPSTEVVRAIVETCEQALARAAHPSEDQLSRARHFAAQLTECRRRDALLADRARLGAAYSDCWCLGRGGRHAVGLAVGGSDGYSDGRTTFREFCPCPDGRAARSLRADLEADLQRTADARAAERAFGLARIAQAFRGLTLDDWRSTQQAEGADRGLLDQICLATNDWWERVRGPIEALGPRVLLLLGHHGEGKSAVAAALLQLWLARGGHGLMVSAQDLFDQLRASYARSGGSLDTVREWEVVAACRQAPLLVLDDLAGEGLSEKNDAWVIPILVSILSHREAERLATIVCSNLAPRDLADHYGTRLAQRIAYSKVATVARFGGLPNLRGEPL